MYIELNYYNHSLNKQITNIKAGEISVNNSQVNCVGDNYIGSSIKCSIQTKDLYGNPTEYGQDYLNVIVSAVSFQTNPKITKGNFFEFSFVIVPQMSPEFTVNVTYNNNIMSMLKFQVEENSSSGKLLFIFILKVF